MTTEARYRAILSNHLPPEAVGWVYSFLYNYKVHFHITRSRSSKYGDYRRPYPGHPFHEISVNGDLSPQFFLWVFLHEAAHLQTHLLHPSAAPHGHEWQAQYALLMREAVAFFPAEVQPLVHQLSARLPLNRALMQRVEQMLRGTANPGAVHLDELPPGSLFRLASKPSMQLQSVERRRTRWLCRDVLSGREYTVSASAEVLTD